jgi:hypothetical protein
MRNKKGWQADLFFRKELMKVRDRLDAPVKIQEVELLIGGMEVVAVQAEAHEDDLDT